MPAAGHFARFASTVILAAGVLGGLQLLARWSPFAAPRVGAPAPAPGSRVSWIVWGVFLGIISNGTCPALLTLLGRGRIAVVPPLELGAAALTAASYAVSSVWEEVAFRRVLIRTLSPHGPAVSVAASAVVFASFHFLAEPPAWDRMVFLTALGVFLGTVYWRTGRLAFAIGVHGGLNLMHLALGGDRGFPALWPFVTRIDPLPLLGLLLLGILLAGGLALPLARERQLHPPRGMSPVG